MRRRMKGGHFENRRRPKNFRETKSPLRFAPVAERIIESTHHSDLARICFPLSMKWAPAEPARKTQPPPPNHPDINVRSFLVPMRLGDRVLHNDALFARSPIFFTHCSRYGISLSVRPHASLGNLDLSDLIRLSPSSIYLILYISSISPS